MPPRAAALLLSSALAVMESHSFGSVTPVISALCELGLDSKACKIGSGTEERKCAPKL